ncbi:MAG TPA: NrfD/PsrC family molybdoenzyme membrane anchor subunit [Terriglobales bacterium]|nr:NrfD/PsrC family molybdoenzyme membrane anchor subunit [Terriglobales bacterium]
MAQASELREADYDLRQTSDDLIRPVETGPTLRYLVSVIFAGLVTLIGVVCWGRQLYVGMGVTGLMWPVMWAVYITNFVFWIGIAHSGTLISAILYLFRAKFRPAFSRSSEAMTIFAVATAGLFPILHLGRAWRFYWVLPYPNERRIWPNFRSPLVLDVFAISTYLTVSLIFWYLGMLPDMAELRDRSRGWKRTLYGVASLGWTGSLRQLSPYMKLYILLAGLATPLVLSVHTTVSWDFSLSLLPGWHEEIFPPYFVAGAIFSGLAMVLTLVIPLRSWFRLKAYITIDHLERLCQLILLTSSIVTFSYATEYFIAWYSGNTYEHSAYWMRAFGHYWKPFWFMIACNCFVPLLFFSRRVRRNIKGMFIISILINVGMWLERFIIIVTTLAYSFDPGSWGIYHVQWIEIGITAGSFGWFMLQFLGFVKIAPSLPVAEVRKDILEARRQKKALIAAGLLTAAAEPPAAPPEVPA